MNEQDSLFPVATAAPVLAVDPHAPLATRMRPRTLEEYEGQHRVVGEGSVLRRAIASGAPPSLILWGPPGTGKTTLAMLIADQSNAAFEPISAVSAGVADIRAVVERAKARRRSDERTVLFIDEIHRFNKTQQDAVLPHVESGLVTLLGATTENPSHQVNAALISRARVVRLDSLNAEQLRSLATRALADTERGLGKIAVSVPDDAMARLVEAAGGDARVTLNGLELAVAAAVDRSADAAVVTVEDIEGALQAPALLFDRNGDQHFWVVSALIKSIRGSDVDASVYWLVRLLESGEDPRFVARRLIISAAEDVGLADPRALEVAVAAQKAVEFIGMPEGYLPLTEATIYLAVAPKSNSALTAYAAAREDVMETLHLPVPLHLRNATSALDRGEAFGAGYANAHDAPGSVAAQQHLPDALVGHTYYTPTDHGVEARFAARVEELRARLRGN